MLISKIDNLKKNYYNKQVLHLKLKTIIGKGNSIYIELLDKGSPILSRIFTKSDDNTTFYSDIYFRLENRFPLIHISLFENNSSIEESTLKIDSSIKRLNPPLDFSSVIAQNLTIKFVNTSVYDEKNNLLSLNLEAKESNLNSFTLKYKNEKITSYSGNLLDSKISYYAIIPNSIKSVRFSYFNTFENRYIYKTLYINPKIENISTQTDISPTSSSRVALLNGLLIILILFWLILFFFKRKWIYLILIIMVISILIFINLPNKKIILKVGTNIHILPTKQSTIFFRVSVDMPVEILGKANGYDKIIVDKKIGWVKDSYVKKN